MNRLLLPAALLLVFAAGLGIRLYDLTDPPLDFHPTRQLRSAVIARGMYFASLPETGDPHRTIAIAQWQQESLIEPPILERIAAGLYRLTGSEGLWVPRALSAVFWLLGGAAVFQLARALSNTGGGLVSLVYFLFLPFAIMASRTFQPDPLMTALIAAALLFLYRWARSGSWRDTVLAGAFSGLAILTKLVAVFPIGMAALALLLARGLRRELGNRQVWTIAGLALFPVAGYYINGLYLAGFLEGQSSFRFFPQMWLDPAFYIRWVEMATGICGATVLLTGIAGVFLGRDRLDRALLAGIWTGYGLYSLTFPYHTITHDYYQLPLIVTAAIALAPAAGLLIVELDRRPYRRLAFSAAALLVAGMALFQAWDARVLLARQDFRSDAARYAAFDGLLPPEAEVISIARAYGYPLAYYGWVRNHAWLNDADATLRGLAGLSDEEFASRQMQRLEENDYFFITWLSELDRQQGLKDTLYANYPVHLEGDGYIVFDLQP